MAETQWSDFVAVDDGQPQTDWSEFEPAPLPAVLRPPTPQFGAGRQAFGRFAQAATGGVAGALESIPIAATAIASKFGDPLLSEADERDVTSRPLYQAGRAIRRVAEQAFPVDPNRPKSFLVDTLPQAAGSMAAFMAGGAAGKLAKASGAATVAALGAGVTGADAFDEAKKSGASDDDAFKVFAINAGLGTTEAVPIGGWLNRLNQASGNKLKLAIKEGSQEAIQEVVQTYGGNLTAQKYYDPNRPWHEGIIEGGGAGFTLGSVVSLLVSGIGGRRARVAQPLPVEAETPAIPVRQQVPSATVLAPPNVTEVPNADKIETSVGVFPGQPAESVPANAARSAGEIQKPAAARQAILAPPNAQVVGEAVAQPPPAPLRLLGGSLFADSMLRQEYRELRRRLGGGVDSIENPVTRENAIYNLEGQDPNRAKAARRYAELHDAIAELAPVAQAAQAPAAALPENIGGAIGGESKNLPANAQAIEAANKAKMRADFQKELDARKATSANANKETGAAAGTPLTDVSGEQPAVVKPVIKFTQGQPVRAGNIEGSLTIYDDGRIAIRNKMGEFPVDLNKVEAVAAKPETKPALPVTTPTPATPVEKTSVEMKPAAVKPVELMTPDEWRKSISGTIERKNATAGEDARNGLTSPWFASKQEAEAWSQQSGIEGGHLQVFTQDGVTQYRWNDAALNQRPAFAEAVKQQKPISVALVDELGKPAAMAIEKRGYVREGDRYVYKPATKPAESVTTPTPAVAPTESAITKETNDYLEATFSKLAKAQPEQAAKGFVIIPGSDFRKGIAKQRMRATSIGFATGIERWDTERFAISKVDVSGTDLHYITKRTPAPPIATPTPATPVAETKPQPMNMAGQVRQKRAPFAGPPVFETLHPKSQEAFNAAWEAKDLDAMKGLLHLQNKGLRAAFEKRVGLKLPKTEGGTRMAINSWSRGAFDKAKTPTPAAAPAQKPTAPASNVSQKQAKSPTTLQQLDALVIQHGLETGRLDDLETLHAPKITETSGLGSMGLAAKRKYSEQIKTARERIVSDLGIAKDKLQTPEGRAEILVKLKERIESTSKLVEVALSDMPEGSEFTVHGEKFTVKDTNEETGIVTLKDGRTLKVNERASVKIDPGSLQAKEATFEPEAEAAVSKGGELGGEIGQTFNLVGEKAKFVEPTKQTTAFGDETLSQNDLFQIEQVTKEVDPFKSADAAQKMYGGAAEAAKVVERQLRTLDQNPEFEKQFDKRQRARLSEVLNLLRERANEFYSAKAEALAAKLETLKTGISGSGQLHAFGIVADLWDRAVSIAQGIIRAGGTVADAVEAAIRHIRSNHAGDFDEAGARSELERAATESEVTGSVIDPATGEWVEASEGAGDIVQIAGIEYNIVGKERLSPGQKAAADARARDFFGKELTLPGEADTSAGKQRGATDTNLVFRIEPDGENHDEAGERLLKHLIEQVQMQHQPGGDPAYVSSLVNALNKNFNVGNLQGVFSDGMIQRLMEISVGESSWRGTMLRAITGITEDMGTVARNAKFFLRRTYENMFGGDLTRKIMDRIALNFRERFTGEEIERLYNENPILQELFLKVVSRLRVKPSLRDVIAEIFATPINKQDDIVERFVDAMVNKFSATPSEAARLKSEFSRTFEASFNAARKKAQEKALASLLPEERKVIGPQTQLWKKLTDLVNSGWFDSAKVVEEYARDKGMKVPTEAEIKQMRNWSIREQGLRKPSPDEVKLYGDQANILVEGATLEKRQELLRQMNTQWSRWTHPVASLRHPSTFGDPVRRYNFAMAANEWLTANLLLKLGFGSRQIIDVGTQMILHTPTRAAQYAFEQWGNDKSAGRDTNLLHNLSQTMTDAYKTRIKVLADTLASFKRTLAGKGEQKNVEQLISSIAVFDRALLQADEMKAQGRPAAARFLHLLALTMRFGRQFAAAADVIQGVPAEAQEIAHQIRTGLREQGKSAGQQELEFNTILGLLTTARVESLAEARQLLEARGLDLTNASIQRAAWHILREKIYSMARTAGLPADEWKIQNHYYRNVLGWNEPETQGLGAIGGPGGAVALTAKVGKELFSKAGFPAFPFVFGNAMGISLNRKLAYTPLGFWPGFFKGSPWFEGERNIRQRKFEAVIGTTIGGTLFTLVALGIWTVLPRKWPDDEKEKAKWTANGWQPGMVIIPVSDTQEMKISTRVGPMSLLSPYLAAGGAFHDATVQQAKKQEALNERAAKLGLTPEKLEGLDAGQWLNVIGSAAYASAVGGRTASGMLGSYTDFGQFSAKKSGAAATSTLIPGLPGFQEISRMSGANINPKLASFWDLLVPLPTSDANRVNLLGDPMRNENDVERIFQVLSGGTAPFPADSDQFKKNKAYTNLFSSDFRPPSINPVRGYQFGNELRQMTETELQRYTAARGRHFASELQSVDVTGLSPKEAKAVVQNAFQRANATALSEVGASPVRAAAQSSAGAGPRAISGAGDAARSTATRRTGSRRYGLSAIRPVRLSTRRRGGTRISTRRSRVSVPRLSVRRIPRGSSRIRIARIRRPTLLSFV